MLKRPSKPPSVARNENVRFSLMQLFDLSGADYVFRHHRVIVRDQANSPAFPLRDLIQFIPHPFGLFIADHDQ